MLVTHLCAVDPVLRRELCERCGFGVAVNNVADQASRERQAVGRDLELSGGPQQTPRDR